MGQTDRYQADPVDRRHRLAASGKLPKTGKSRRSDLIRAIAESEREEAELHMGDDGTYDSGYYDEMLEEECL